MIRYALLLLSTPIFAQSTLPVIRAGSKTVAINDGGYLDKNAWTVSPRARPDIFTADRTRKTKWVIFYTDTDSIRVKVKPGTRFNFIILLNGKDSCYTQIASAIPPAADLTRSNAANDTIPFTLTAFNAIHVKAIINDTDTLNLHFDASSFNFRFTKDAIVKRTKLLSGQPGVEAGTAKPDFNHMDKVFKLQMGNRVWASPETSITSLTAHEMDGRFGWNLFENKLVEIDYDNNLFIIRSALPARMEDYKKAKLKFIRSFPVASADFEIENKKYSGDFLFDTGADAAIIADSAWASQQNFPVARLQTLKSLVLHDPRGVPYETRVVLSPVIKINDCTLSNIPTLMLAGKNPLGFSVNYFGNDFLKRFNIIFDFKHDYFYLKPNKLMGLPYKERA